MQGTEPASIRTLAEAERDHTLNVLHQVAGVWWEAGTKRPAVLACLAQPYFIECASSECGMRNRGWSATHITGQVDWHAEYPYVLVERGDARRSIRDSNHRER
jgi:hypothetical protein